MRGVAFRGEHAGDPGVIGSLRRYTRNALLAPVVLIGLLMGVWIVRAPGGFVVTAALLLGLAGALAVHAWRMLGALRDPVVVVPLRRALPEALLTTVLACLAVAQEPRNTFFAMLIGMSATILLLGRQAKLGWGLVAALAIGSAGAISAIVALTHPDAAEVASQSGLISLGLIMFFAWAEYISLRQWAVTLELEHARRAADELASTRERLRVAEDLHDVLGHALEVVAFKSELAARLSEHDGARSRAEMEEVQRLARGALHDVRELVQGNRETDLAAEFDSVRDLLSSAGIECECVGDPESLAAVDSALFGRVLREAATNLLRHANPRHCAVTLSADDESATLSIRNDGSATEYQAPEGDGSGLAGLARRVEAVGGSFRAGPAREPSTFEVRASVPAAAVR